MGSRILLIEDEPAISASIAYNLRREGHSVTTASDGALGLDLARRDVPDLVILDVMLPRMDGFEVCRNIRQSSAAELRQVPIIVVTARTDEGDRVVGLDLGADDYVVKPFSMRELTARTKALLRRSSPAGKKKGIAEPLASGGIVLDVENRRATRNGRSISLKPREFDLLACLMQAPGRVFSREDLLDRAWGTDFVGDLRTVDVHVRWLREKLEDDPAKPKFIETIRGVGYRIRTDR
jgi:DNA-binding response OmpR family regulator